MVWDFFKGGMVLRKIPWYHQIPLRLQTAKKLIISLTPHCFKEAIKIWLYIALSTKQSVQIGKSLKFSALVET